MGELSTDRAKNRQLAIFDELRNEIRSGKYRTAERFPSETALARRFGCSRQSVVHALMSLQDLGLLHRERGSGTYLTKKARKYGASVGLIVPGLGCGDIFPHICNEISRLAQEEGVTLLFGGDTSCSAEARAQKAMALARQFVETKVAGVIFQPLEFYENAENYNREIVSVFTKAKIPVILIDSDIVATPERSDCDLVGINNFDVGRKIARHLLECGARRIAFLKKPNCANTVLDRIFGAKTAVEDSKGCSFRTVVAEPFDLEAVERLVRGRNRVDAVICGNDAVASRLLATLRKIGMRVPDDVLVTGVDDLERARLVTPELTTVHQPCEAIAATAFRFLVSRIENPSIPPRECFLSAPLVVRASTMGKSDLHTAKTKVKP